MRIALGAFYIDLVQEDTASTPRPTLINRNPEAGETDVPIDSIIDLMVVDLGAAGLDDITTVEVDDGQGGGFVMAFDQNNGSPLWHADYTAASTFTESMSPGSTVIDEHRVQLKRATNWVSEAVISVRVTAQTADLQTLNVTYSFTIADVTKPEIYSATSLGFRRVRLRFTEPVAQDDGGLGDALAVRDISGGISFTAPDRIHAPGGNFTQDDVGLCIGIARSDAAVNNGSFIIESIVSSMEVQIEAVTPELEDMDASPDVRGYVGPYVLQGVLDPDRIYPVFSPVVIEARQPSADPDRDPLPIADDANLYVDLILESDLSPERDYTLRVLRVADLAPEPNYTDENETFTFTVEPLPLPTSRAYAQTSPNASRNFHLWENLVSDYNRRHDINHDTERFLRCLQDQLGHVLAATDKFTELWDASLTPKEILDALLMHLGSPFTFTPKMTAAQKRALIEALVRIYKANGTELGIEGALLLILGISCDVRALNQPGSAWILDVSLLGVDTYLGVDTEFLLYSFEVECPVPLTDDEVEILTEIVEYMKPAHTHFIRLIMPAGTPPSIPGYWILGSSTLDETTYLGA